MEKIKVLQIIPSFEVGGAEKVVLDYLLNQNMGNIEMKAVSLYSFRDTIYTRKAMDEGIDIIFLNKKKGIDLKMIFCLYKVMREFKPDVVHTHQYSLKYAIIPSLFLKIKKTFHTIHSKPEKDASGIDKEINKICFKYLGVIPIVLHEKMKEETNHYYDITKSVVVSNGINGEAFDNISESRNDILKILEVPINTFVVGHVGSFIPVKNHDFIINVFYEIIKKRDAYLILIGDGYLKKEVIDKCNRLHLFDRVKFLGHRSDVPRIMTAMDIFIFPSLYEGLPLSLIEAQMAGLKCLVSNNVDKSILVNENIIQLDLKDGACKWSDFAISNIKNELKFNKAREKYSIRKSINRLEDEYRC